MHVLITACCIIHTRVSHLIMAFDKDCYLAWQGGIRFTVHPLHFLDTSNVSLLNKTNKTRFSPSSGPVNPVEDFV